MTANTDPRLVASVVAWAIDAAKHTEEQEGQVDDLCAVSQKLVLETGGLTVQTWTDEFWDGTVMAVEDLQASVSDALEVAIFNERNDVVNWRRYEKEHRDGSVVVRVSVNASQNFRDDRQKDAVIKALTHRMMAISKEGASLSEEEGWPLDAEFASLHGYLFRVLHWNHVIRAEMRKHGWRDTSDMPNANPRRFEGTAPFISKRLSPETVERILMSRPGASPVVAKVLAGT